MLKKKMSGDQEKNKLIIGTWGLFEWANENPFEILRRAYELGFKKYDTAMIYGSGEAEKTLARLPADIEIHTKIPSLTRRKENTPEESYPRDYFRRLVDKSLERLGTSNLDVLYFHNWSSAWQDLGHFRELFSLVGKNVTQKGVSLPSDYNLDVDRFPLNQMVDLFDVFQVPYCVASPGNKGIIKYFLDHGKRIVIRSVFGHGTLLKGDEEMAEGNPFLRRSSFEERNEMRCSTSQINLEDRLWHCITSAHSIGDVEIVVGVSKMSHLKDIATQPQ